AASKIDIQFFEIMQLCDRIYSQLYILLSLPQLPSEVSAVAYEHHEDNLGTGYPRRLTKHAIHPFTQIVRVANLFAEFALKSPSHPGMGAAGALNHIELHYKEGLNSDSYGALRAIFENAASKAA
ncbi:MAG: hypothetical protein C5B49_06045, partial [Bdellovibrio sp.]